MSRSSHLFCGILLALACACGGGGGAGGGPAASATTLVYSNPTGTTNWRLDRDVASTPARLVLDLMAPDGASGQGVTLTLTASGVATWHAFSPGVYLQGLAYPSPLVNVSSVQGSALRIVAAQAPGTPVLYGTAPVLKVALDLVAGAAPGSLTLSAAAAGHLGTDPTPVAITIVSGSLLAQ